MNNLNDQQKEQLSAFIDNEVGPESLAEIDSADSSLHRYQLIGDAIRGQVSDASLIDVSAQLSLALENEPTYGDAASQTAQNAATAQINSAPWFDFSGWLRPIGGMAVAASVAVVMVMVINQPDTSIPGASGTGGQMATFESQPVVSLPVSNNGLSAVGSANISTGNAVIDKKLDENVEKLPSGSHLRDRVSQ